jgi:hypothetical protein
MPHLLVLTSSEQSRSEEGGAAIKATPPLVRASLSADQSPEKSLQPGSTNETRQTGRIKGKAQQMSTYALEGSTASHPGGRRFESG